MIHPEITPFHEAVAQAHGVELFGRYEEAEAAAVLGYAAISLRRLRTSGQIGCLKLSPRKIFYLGYQLVDFLLQAVEEQSCRATPQIQSASKSGIIGSHDKAAVPHGAERGSTQRPDKRAVLASAQRILTKPNNG